MSQLAFLAVGLVAGAVFGPVVPGVTRLRDKVLDAFDALKRKVQSLL